MALKHALVLLLACALTAAAQQADAQRGAKFFETQKCTSCHPVGNTPSTGAAPNLSRTLDRDYTPSGIAARMWNHAPSMWSAMNKAGIETPQVSEDQAADLFAFLYSARYFDRPGDAGRGRRAFADKGCGGCHPASKIAQATSVSDPIALVDHMWNHVTRMKPARWPELTSQDLTDIQVYVRNLPEARKAKAEFVLPPNENGAQLFASKGCANCHKGANALRLQARTLTEVAAAMWNHAPKMKQPAIQVTYEEMRQLLAYLWSNQFFNPPGDSAKGKRVFESKRCASCHNQPPAVGTLPAMVAALWKHGPTMLSTMEKKGVDWPLLTAPEVSNLIAYMKK